MHHSDYIVYVDESGDTSLKTINEQYPVFCLTFCIFEHEEYIRSIAPELNLFKKRYWGHCDVVLHERDIRKSMSKDYSFLNQQSVREQFLSDLSDVIQHAKFQLVSCVIDKHSLKDYKSDAHNAYECAMLICMEKLNKWLLKQGQAGKHVNIHVEARGKEQDLALELEFRRILDGKPSGVSTKSVFTEISYNLRFLDKKANSTGLQFADLFARCIGLSVFRSGQENRAFEMIKDRFIHAKALRVFPPKKQ